MTTPTMTTEQVSPTTQAAAILLDLACATVDRPDLAPLFDAAVQAIADAITNAVANERQRCVGICTDQRVYRRLPPYEDLKADESIGEYWPHPGCAYATAIRKG